MISSTKEAYFEVSEFSETVTCIKKCLLILGVHLGQGRQPFLLECFQSQKRSVASLSTDDDIQIVG